MKIETHLIVSLLLLLLVSCSKKKEKQDLLIDSDTISFFSLERIEKNIPNDLSIEKRYIKLDNSDQFLFRGIDKVKIIDNNIYILDRRLNRLVVFDVLGNGVVNVDKLGQGAEEYLQITDFDVDSSGYIYILDGRLDKLFVYDKHSNFISVNKLPFEADIISVLSNDKLLFGLSSWNKGKGASKKIALTNMNLEIEETYMDYDEFLDEAYWISTYNFVEFGDCVFYNKQIDNIVYELAFDGQPVKAHVFDFGRKNVPNKNRKDIEGSLQEFESYCCLKNFVVVTNEYALGTVWDELKTKAFIIDRKKKILYLGKETTDNDKSSITGVYKDYIISFINLGNKNLDDDIPLDVKKYVENGDFVICLYKLP